MMYRCYFNSHLDYPLVCSIDTGDGSKELNTKSLTIVGTGLIKFVYRKERQPKFWAEVAGTLEITDGHAIIEQS